MFVPPTLPLLGYSPPLIVALYTLLSLYEMAINFQVAKKICYLSVVVYRILQGGRQCLTLVFGYLFELNFNAHLLCLHHSAYIFVKH